MQPTARVLGLESAALRACRESDSLLDRPANTIDLDPVLPDLLWCPSLQACAYQPRGQFERFAIKGERMVIDTPWVRQKGGLSSRELIIDTAHTTAG